MDSDYYKIAKRKVKEKKKFQKHLQSFITVNAIMMFLGFMMGFWRGWIYVPFFWAIGLFFHYFKAYGYPGMEDEEDWEEKELEKEIRRMKRKDKDLETPQPTTQKGKKQEDFDIDGYLDLNEPQKEFKKKNYREDDLV